MQQQSGASGGPAAKQRVLNLAHVRSEKRREGGLAAVIAPRFLRAVAMLSEGTGARRHD